MVSVHIDRFVFNPHSKYLQYSYLFLTPLIDALKAQQKYSQVHLHCIEVGSLGYAANTCREIHQYLKCGRGHPRVNVFMRKVGKKCLQTSLEIFRKRDKALLYEKC